MTSRLLNLKKGEIFQGNLRGAIFGTGYWSTLELPAWQELVGLEIVAAYNRTVSKAERIAEQFNIPSVYSDPEELLRNEEIDFMVIITEVPAHASLVFLGAKYHIPIICQKPMGPDYETCKRMVQSCKDSGIPFFINENFRWQPPFRALKQVLNESHIGKPYRAQIQFGNGGVETYIHQPFLKTLKHSAITDMGSHIFDLVRFLFGETQSLYCLSYKAYSEMAGEDNYVALLHVGDLMCTCEICEFYNTKAIIEGHNGWIELKPDNNIHIHTRDQTVIRDTANWPHHKWISSRDENYIGGDCVHSIYLSNQHLLNALRTGQAPETTGEDNLKTARLVFAAIESVENQEVIHLS